jgi:uncharacterized protein (DUF2252 family)
MAQAPVHELPDVLTGPVATPAQRREDGRLRRGGVPRSAHAEWEPSPDRRDPVEVLIEVSKGRLPDLVPLRNRRMMTSPFAFFRGSALQMALDLATTPSSGIEVQLCGDAHVMNFGVFASPERSLMFDLNDFDETAPGPFEWDVKRMATSAVIAARELGMKKADQTAAAVASAQAYRTWLERYAEMTQLDVWYAKLDAQNLLDLMSPTDRRSAKASITKALSKDHHAALTKLTRVVDGKQRIVPDPPYVVRLERHDDDGEQLARLIDGYRDSLQADRRALIDRYRLVDIARKVVGVGSVGTRCYVLLFQGPNGGPLFMQAKEAGVSAIHQAGLGAPALHYGQRVVEGQRMLQATSDVLLGWTTAPHDGIHYYVRQLWDAKGSADLNGMTPTALATYAGACGWALARAHARTGDSVHIAGYLGGTGRFDQAVAAFAHAYADQNERDHQALVDAAGTGVVPVSPAG